MALCALAACLLLLSAAMELGYEPICAGRSAGDICFPSAFRDAGVGPRRWRIISRSIERTA
ncbi:MAG: hypothetical protein ACLUHE_00605 [Christensenellales bacterium]